MPIEDKHNFETGSTDRFDQYGYFTVHLMIYQNSNPIVFGTFFNNFIIMLDYLIITNQSDNCLSSSLGDSCNKN